VTEKTDARIGTTVGGKYLITDVIGRGGMGTVYRAVHRDLGEPVAVKFLHGIFAHDRELLARFRREAVALARLRHPGIVSLLDVSEGDDDPFMVMELVRGRSLADALDEMPGTMAIPRIGSIFVPLLEVLELAHAEGIVHRDIKPSNVMLLESDHVKLLDFGLVHLPGTDIEKLTQTGIVHGTPDYMSPEQCHGDPTGPPTDVYAVGVMLYEALAGRLPFEGHGPAVLMAAHLFLEPPTMAERSRGRVIPAPFQQLVNRAMAKSAADRPTATTMRHELTAILRGTDEATLAENASRERARVGALSRGERAFTGSHIEAEDSSSEAITTASRVLVWVRDEARARSIRSALGVSGAVVKVERGEAVAPASEPAFTAIIVAFGEGPVGDRLAHLAVTHPRVPVLVADIPGAEATTDVIRAGASDMTLEGAPDSDLSRRVARLARRKR
jgi:eukaryotic-like serine/threonine-protein kinase